MKKSIRLSDVARVAGVSVGTVSNTFNKPELVRPEVRDLVHATARKLDYSGPDPKGRLLMGGKTNTIGVLLPGDISVTHSVKSPYFHDFMLGIAEVCDENSASLMIVSGAEERKNWAIRNALVDGFILGHVDEVGLISLRHKEVPFVVMDMDAGPGVNSVRIEARSGARRAAEHLLALGHRKFAIVSVLRKSTPPILHAPASSARQLVKAYPLEIGRAHV